jgi:endonuclease/exonuclease/phosphatase family metal-dependent hydrolase
VEVDGATLHLWVSHPTPPVFDGPENRNGRRNFDEIGFWVRYLEGSDALYDDQGGEGGYRAGEPFVIAGDLNADPDGGDATVDGVPAISQLLDHPRIVDPEPHRDRPTAEFGDGARVDYLLPSRELTVVDGGVVVPSLTDDPELADAAREASDHFLVWLEVGVPRER